MLFETKLTYFSSIGGGDDEYDFDAELAEFENEWEEESDEESEGAEGEEELEEESDEEEEFEESDEEESDEEELEEESDEEEYEEEEEEDEEEEPNLETEAQNRAFQRLRQEAQAGKKASTFLQKLAEQAGLKNVDELMEYYEDRQIRRQAEEEGKPEETIRRERREAEEAEQQAQREREETFNNEVASFVENNNLSEQDISKVFAYMATHNYADDNGNPTIRFEDAYFLANRDTFQKQERSRGRQEYLQNKKKRVKNSAVNPGNSVSKVDTQEIDDDFIDEKLKEFGIEI